MMRKILAVLMFLFASPPAFALSQEEGSLHGTKTILDYIGDYVDVPAGALDWKVLGSTNEVQIQTKTDDGYDLIYQKPEFQPDVMALDGKEITIKGYMFPLDVTEDQRLFLFGPFPMSCPYQYHVGPALVLEVHAQDHPVAFSYDPVQLTGTLELVPEDKEYSVFYRLKDARKVN
jgi:hypothetical protein